MNRSLSIVIISGKATFMQLVLKKVHLADKTCQKSHLCRAEHLARKILNEAENIRCHNTGILHIYKDPLQQLHKVKCQSDSIAHLRPSRVSTQPKCC